jgi:Xaa-Pro aminopeptidase
MKTSENLLLVADSERDANMLYAVGMFVPDPFIYLRLRDREMMVMSDLEIDRARTQAPHCRVVSLTQRQQRLRKRGVASPGLAHVIQDLLRERGVRQVGVPHNFPHGLALELERLRVRVKVGRNGAFPQRQFKSAAEVKKISAALAMAEVGMAEAMQVLRRTRIGRNRQLLHNSAPLTSERLRAVIDTAITQAGGLASHTIVAGGLQACDPHEKGHGPLRAHEPIILDIFPRSQKTGYFGDITRTVVRGRATEAARRLYATVQRGQELAFGTIHPGVPARDVHAAVLDFFRQEGFKSGKQDGRMRGFFHGTGHGLGLEIHEPPRLNAVSTAILQAGHVVTVEPGLYYPGIGGVRLEDVALVKAGCARNLTHFEKVFEL